jgi:regulatory protein
MMINSIVPPRPSGKVWTLCLEDGKTLRVGEAEMMEFALHTGMELNGEQMKKLSEAGAFSALRDRAVSILSQRLCSKNDLFSRLMDKGATQKQAEEVVCWAERIGLINEGEYAKTIVRHYSAKGYGIFKVKDELYRRKLPKDLWEDALKELKPPEENIERYLRTHLKSVDPKAIKKVSDALARRGFTWSEISDGLERFRIFLEEDKEVYP